MKAAPSLNPIRVIRFMESHQSEPKASDQPAGNGMQRLTRRQTRLNAPTIFVLCLFLGVLAARKLISPPAVPYTTSQSVFTADKTCMGAPWSIKVAATNGMTSDEIARSIEAAFAEVDRVESIMSEWRPDSPISAINASAGKDPIEVPDELRKIILRANELSRLSNGAFDITWKGMGNLWRWSDEDFSAPSEEEINQARQRVDYRKIEITENRVGLKDPGMEIGLGGIAKGYGVDRAALILRDAGLRNFMIDGGGDILTAGVKFGSPWRLGIQHPREGRDVLMAALDVTDAALVTSGDYERARVIDGRRVHHILDPRTGMPASKCRSVSVVAPDAETADALATTIFVLGPKEGLRLISDRPRTEALIIDADGRLWKTDGFGTTVGAPLP